MKVFNTDVSNEVFDILHRTVRLPEDAVIAKLFLKPLDSTVMFSDGESAGELEVTPLQVRNLLDELYHFGFNIPADVIKRMVLIAEREDPTVKIEADFLLTRKMADKK